MKRATIAARKVTKGKLAQELQRGEAPFRGAQGPKGPKEPKDLRGSKGLLLMGAEELALGEERYPATGTPPAPSRSSSTAARRSGRR